MVILSLLGLSVNKNQKSFYQNGIKNLTIKEDEYINSIDCMVKNYDEKFIFLGTNEAIDKHKKELNLENKNIEFVGFKNGDLNDIFLKIINILIQNKDEKIVFDITHSFRDSVLMSVISTIVTQAIYNPNIEMIYARELKKYELYKYELVSEEILNTSNIAILLSTFLDTLKVPKVYSKYKLHKLLEDFSNHLVSNQFKDIYENDIVNIEKFINDNKANLFFVKPLLDKLENFVLDIKTTQNQTNYQKFLFFAEIFVEKDYFLHSSTYLIEAITLYIGEVLKKQEYVKFDVDEYANAQKIVGLLKFVPDNKNFYFPNDYFLDINYKVFLKFSILRDNVAEIRHNLAHINMTQSYGEIKKELQELIKEFKNLIEDEVLFKLDTSLDKKEKTIKYKIEKYQDKLKSFKLNSKVTIPKIENVYEKYKNNELDKLQSSLKIDNLKKFLDKNFDEIDRLFKMKKNRILLEG